MQGIVVVDTAPVAMVPDLSSMEATGCSGRRISTFRIQILARAYLERYLEKVLERSDPMSRVCCVTQFVSVAKVTARQH